MLLSVGSDQSVALWRTPTDRIQPAALSDPTNHLVARFRKTGNLGHLLTPTSVAWLHDLKHFAVSYSESVVAIFDAESGQEISEMSIPIP
jgi:WD40 repeat protein